MAGTIGSLTVFAKVDTTSYSKGLKKAKTDTSTFADFFKSKLDLLKNPFVVMGAAATAAAGVMLTKFAAAGDAIEKMSVRTGIAAHDVQSMTFAFEQSGQDASTFENSVKKLNMQLVDLDRGVQLAVDNFADIGVAAKDLEGLNQADRIRLVVKSLANIKDEGKRAGVALKIFGRAGMQMIPLIKDMEALETQYKKMGIGMTQEQVDSAAILTDSWNILTKSLGFLSTEFISVFAPAISMATDLLGGLIRFVGGAVKAIGNLISGPLSVLTNIGKNIFEFFGGTGATTLNIKAFNKSKKESNDMKKTQEKMGTDIAESKKLEKKQLGELTKIKKSTAKLPPTLKAGSAATISFINNLRRNDAQRQMVDLLKSMDEGMGDQLKEMKKPEKLKTAFVLRPLA